MLLIPFSFTPTFEQAPKIRKAAANFQLLLEAIGKRQIPKIQLSKINEIISGLNDFSGSDPNFLKAIKSGQAAILKLLEKELKVTPPGHYQTLYMAIGMAAFGIPMGVVFGSIMGNMGLLSLGIPIGMSIGLAVGTSMDSKAKNEGRQLDWKSISPFG